MTIGSGGSAICCRLTLIPAVDEGASFAVNVGGECVVDLWGGYRDLAHTEPWERDTIVRVFSTSKAVVTIATLVLWDRGLVDLDVPIATYWPEFAQNGKATITTRDVLVHRSGLPGFGCVPTRADLHDWDRMIDIVERGCRVVRAGHDHLLSAHHVRLHPG